jgi:hypothetical protein
MICPLESLHIAAWTENYFLIAVSKFILNEPAEGGDHNSFVIGEEDFQAAA